ncbi:amidase [Povalibacter sp.]|uniref:amidase n=1 Tax=Povalibacter sp. TaxID=1962978 RepID=UPI002F405419
MNRSRLSGLIAAVALAAASVPSPSHAARFDLSTATVDDIQAAFAAGTLTSERLIALYQARIDAYERKGPAIGAIIAINGKALEEARSLDQERKAKGSRGPLHGIPVVLKDNIDTVDMPTTGGSFVLDGAQPSADAPIVRRLREAGAIIFAKVNLDDFAAGGSGFSSVRGQTRNPYDPGFTPLGSSGGSGAALAAWFAPLALGTDTGGSLRSPSSVNGVYGLKPTTGLLSRTGIIPTCYSFDAAGPMARNVTDLAAMLGPMTGADATDRDTSASLGLAHRDYSVFLGRKSLAGLRIGVMREGTGADPEVDAAFEQALARLKALGADVVDNVKYPPQVVDGATRRAVVKVVCDTEKAVYFDDYLGKLADGYPKTLSQLAQRGLELREPRGSYGPHPVIYDGLARRVSSGQGMDSLAYLSAKQHGVEMMRTGVMGIFEGQRLDVLVYPTRPRRPHRIIPDEPLTGRSVPPPPPGTAPVGVGLTNIANITGFPDLVAPAGLTAEGLPVSISFFGPAFSEPLLLAVAHAYEQAMPRLPLPAHTPVLRGEVFKY